MQGARRRLEPVGSAGPSEIHPSVSGKLPATTSKLSKVIANS